MMISMLDQLFVPEPLTWGLRGDMYAWQAMRDRLADVSVPATAGQISEVLHGAFAEVVGVDLARDDAPDHIFREELAHGGMSSGKVDLPTWRARLMPLLEERGRVLVETPAGP